MSTKASMNSNEGQNLKRNERIALQLLTALLVFRILLDLGIRYDWGNGLYWLVTGMGVCALALSIWIIMNKRFSVLWKVIRVIVLAALTYTATLPFSLMAW